MTITITSIHIPQFRLLLPGQELNYYYQGKGRSIIPVGSLTAAALLEEGRAKYLRCEQPFHRPGDNICIFFGDRYERTSALQSREARGNKLFFRTRNSLYVIEYANIDLERVLREGRPAEEGIPPFPPMGL